jgi:ABC-2 type transport system permease protein
MFIFFTLLFMTASIPFWMPEVAWGAQFLIVVIVVEFLSGSLFPIDILPGVLQKILYASPFPYLIFFPLQTYLGKLPVNQVIAGLTVSIAWSVVLWLLLKYIWSKGLKVYQAYGR